jgi:tetratricopeptide (TPR) repeat protein
MILAAEAAGERPDKAAMVRVLKAASRIGPDDKEMWASTLAMVEKQIRDDAKEAGVEQRAATDKEATVRAALAADPLNPARHLMLAQTLQRQNDVKGAKACLNAALEIDPHFSWAHMVLGNLLRKCGDVDGAEAALRAVMIPEGPEAVVPPAGDHLTSIHSPYAMAQNNLGDLLRIEREDFVGAATAFRAAAAADPTFVQAHENLGSLLIDEMGDFAGAEAAYSEVLRFDPDCHHARIQIARAGVYLRGEVAGPEATYRAAIAADPTRSDAYFRLAVDVLWRRNDIDGAAANLRKCIALDPTRREAHANLATLLWQTDDIDGAEASFRDAIAVHPEYAHAHVTHGMLLALGRGDLAGAARKFAAVLKFDPAHDQAQVGQHSLGACSASCPCLDLLTRVAVLFLFHGHADIACLLAPQVFTEHGAQGHARGKEVRQAKRSLADDDDAVSMFPGA